MGSVLSIKEKHREREVAHLVATTVHHNHINGVTLNVESKSLKVGGAAQKPQSGLYAIPLRSF